MFKHLQDRVFLLSVSFFVSAVPMLANGQVNIENTPVDGKIDWVFDYEKAKEQSLKNGKPMFVVFRCER